LVPQAAAHAGISFDDLVLRILNTAGEQFTA
jgi:D-alanine-D-alanine ligase